MEADKTVYGIDWRYKDDISWFSWSIQPVQTKRTNSTSSPLNHTAAKSKQATKVRNGSLDSVCECLHYPNSSLDNNPNCRNQFSQQNDIDYLKLHYEKPAILNALVTKPTQNTKHVKDSSTKNDVDNKTCKIMDSNPLFVSQYFHVVLFENS